MTDITHDEIRDLLPDLLHSRLDEARRLEIEAHLHSCAECATEMRVLQMVKSAPSFAPMIDAVKVSSVILPYGGVPAERPRTRNRIWQMALATAAVVVIGVTLLSRGDSVKAPAAVTAVATVPISENSNPTATVAISPAAAPTRSATKSRELQLAVGLDGLSDGSLAQLASDLDGLDGLPSADPENLGVTDLTAGGEGGQ